MSSRPATSPVCPACGTALERTRAFATHDGYILVDECPNCGWPPRVGTATARTLPEVRTALDRAAQVLADEHAVVA